MHNPKGPEMNSSRNTVTGTERSDLFEVVEYPTAIETDTRDMSGFTGKSPLPQEFFEYFEIV